MGHIFDTSANANSHMAFTLGRPRAINSSDCTVVPPLDCNIPADPSTTVPMALSSLDSPSYFTPHLFQYAVCQQIHEAMSLGAQKRHLEDYELINILHHRILSLMSDLPPVHRPVNPNTSWDSSHPNIPKQRQQIATAAHSFLLALHKPHAKIRVASRDAAVEAAISTLDAQERLFDLMATQYYSIYALSVYTVDAAIFLSVTTLEHPPSDPGVLNRIYRVIGKAICRLELARERISLANSALQIVKLCFIKMQPLPPFQLHTPDHIVQPPHQSVENFSYDQTQLGGPSSHISHDFPIITDTNDISMFDPVQLDSAAMFDEITLSSFDIESWVKHMNSTTNLNWD